ncbi:MAG: DUF2264 domain-containing protein [Phycisphaeraceae bacterium]|nr:MAG: DUF2264 domain-containing protein [Phycisphaeraceae bacterium]
MSSETWTYDDFAARAGDLLAPLVALMEPGRATIPIEGPPSDHGEGADRFEAFARPCLLAALWLRADARDHPVLDRDAIAAWFREGLLLGTDPTNGEFWGVLSNFDQRAVEMAILVMALDIARETLWEPLGDDGRNRVAGWLAQIRGHAGHHNNHLFFDVLVLEFLRGEGRGEPEDGPCIDWLFGELERMHQGGGWFIDGTNETYDHYNAYAFHIYGLYWAWRYGASNSERAARWKGWAGEFIRDYARLFSARGEPVPIGRSLTYRFNGLGVFALAAMLGLDTVGPGEMRRICRTCIGFFLSHPISQSQGCLSLGWTDRFEALAEPYSCAGSPYWAAKGLLMLLLDRDHPFFTAPERPIPAERDEPPTLVRAPSWVVRNVSGEVEIVNAGGGCSFSAAARFGRWKWGRLAYRTSAGFLVSPDMQRCPPDSGLTAAIPGRDEWFGRHKSMPIVVDVDHAAMSYTLSAPRADFTVNVVTDIWWRDVWLLRVHRVRAAQKSVIRGGSYALAADDGETIRQHVDAARAVAASGCLASVIVPLVGYSSLATDHIEQASQRQHLYAACHAAPYAQTATIRGEHLLAELVGFGPEPLVETTWTLESAVAGEWVLQPEMGTTWWIHSERLPCGERG